MAAFARPSTVGAIAPSSRHLAEVMARAATGADALIELGAGTGAITGALCRRFPRLPTLAVEMDLALARHLAQRFPRVEVRAAPAHEVLLEQREQTGNVVLVSSLPFRSLPAHWRRCSSLAIENFLLERPARRLLQYSYLPWEPFPLQNGQDLRWRKLCRVSLNLPPAWVWELSPHLPAVPAARP